MEIGKNVINITQCDNLLTIVAISKRTGFVYQVAQVGSGPAVIVNVALRNGTFVEPAPILNPEGRIGFRSDTEVGLPAGDYLVYYTGLNVSGPYNFEFSLNGTPHSLFDGKAAARYGYVWNHGGPQPSNIEFTID